jgi:diguanylate cyclase (GGDEF)-like protein/PAS domain S-box-containing protein
MDEVACQMLGRERDEAHTGRAWGHLIHPDDLPLTLHAMQAHLDGETPSYRVEYRARHFDGRWIWLSSKGKVVQFSQEGKPLRMVGTLADISVRKQVEERLRETQSELQATLSALPDLLFEFDATGHYLSVHSQDPDSLILPIDEMIDKSVTEVLPSDAAQAYQQAFEEAHQRGRSHGIQYSLNTSTGKRWYELSVAKKPTEPWKDERFIAIVRDISERKKAEEAIQYIAFHDSLTNLPNRRLLTERLQQALLASTRSHSYGAVMFLDLDRFKQLNDTHGHEMGDLLLQEVARRLQLSIRSVDTAARLGGDEFVVLIQDLSSNVTEAQTQARVVGNKVLSSLNQPYDLHGHLHTSTPSIGIALFNNSQIAPNEVIKQADAAMYAAKAAGRNTVCFFQPSLAPHP